MAIAGVILAGGKSTRMGRDKALLEINGETLLNHAKDIMHRAGIANVYISRKDHISDIIEDCGPLSGIHAAIATLMNKYDAAIITPVDMPGLTPELLSILHASNDDDSLVRFEKHPFPCRIKLGTEVFEKLEQCLTASAFYSLTAFQDSLSPCELSIPDRIPATATQNPFDNVNNPGEFFAFKKAAEK